MGSFARVRFFGILLLAGVALTAAQAQEQESKLMERLLKPDMTLQNSAQSKQFVASGSLGDKQANVRDFYVGSSSPAKPYTGERSFSARNFDSQRFRDGDGSASLSTRTQVPDQKAALATRIDSSVRDSAYANKTMASSDYAGSRPFLGRGKSQKALSQQATPLTIEQVRELLNKNK